MDIRDYLPTLEALADKHGLPRPSEGLTPAGHVHACLAIMAVELGIWKQPAMKMSDVGPSIRRLQAEVADLRAKLEGK